MHDNILDFDKNVQFTSLAVQQDWQRLGAAAVLDFAVDTLQNASLQRRLSEHALNNNLVSSPFLRL